MCKLRRTRESCRVWHLGCSKVAVRPAGHRNHGHKVNGRKYLPVVTGNFLPAALRLAAGQSRPASAQEADSDFMKDPVVAPAGTVLRARLSQALDTWPSQPGDRFAQGSGAAGEILAADLAAAGQVVEARTVALDGSEIGGQTVFHRIGTVARSSHRMVRAETMIGGSAQTDQTLASRMMPEREQTMLQATRAYPGRPFSPSRVRASARSKEEAGRANFERGTK